MRAQKTWDEEKNGPAVWIDGGDFSAFGSSQEIDSSGLIVETMARMKYAAVNIGPREIFQSYGPFDRVVGSAALPYFSANIRALDTGERLFPPYRIIEVPSRSESEASLRIGVIGIAAHREGLVGFGPDGRTAVIAEPGPEIASLVREVRARADIVAVIAAGDPSTIDQIVQGSSDIDLVLVAGTGFVWKEPKPAGKTRIFLAGDRGRDLLRVSILGERSDFKYRFEKTLLGERTMPEDPETAAVVEAAVTRFNEQSREAMKAEAAKLPPADISPFLGVAKCAECHAREHQIWAATKHAHAFETLLRAQRDYTKTCVGCHVTASSYSEGVIFINPARTPQLLGVQCEECHGPGRDHVKDPHTPYGAVDVPTACMGCHDPKDSPDFSFEAFWPKIAH